MRTKTKKGFTLIELLIVIGILAILATAVTLVLNPAELLRQARDTTRISDIDTIAGALNLYTTTASNPDLDGTIGQTCTANCWVHASGVAANCGARHGTKTTSSSVATAVNGTGWIPVNLASTTGGSPIARLPVDPTNSATYFYSYACDSSAATYEVDAAFESVKYLTDDDRDGKDGGSSSTVYEVGTDPGLDL